MKKILVALMFASLLVPVACFAAGSGGSAPPYHMRVEPLCRTDAAENWSISAQRDSCTWTLCVGALGKNYIGAPETTCAYDTRNLVAPMGAGAFMGLVCKGSQADSISISPQVSWDGDNWMDLLTSPAAVMVIPAADGMITYPIAEASTVITTPMWPMIRFCIQHCDGTGMTVAIANFEAWWISYEKD